MLVKIANVLIAMITLVVLGACAAGTDPMRLTSRDNGSTVHVKQGEKFEVVLEGNPTTGYTWEVAGGSGDQVVLQGQPEFKADSDALGSGGMMTLQFKAVQQGTAPLKLIYHRTFEPDVAPLESFEVTVVVD